MSDTEEPVENTEEENEEPEEEELENEEDDEEKDENEEGEEAVPLKSADKDVVTAGLSVLGRTGNGLNFAYLRLDLKEKELSDVRILASYKYLQHVDVSNNLLTTLEPFNSIPHLCSLNASGNQLKSLDLETKHYLQILDISRNNLSSLPENIEQPRLKSLNIADNRINSLDKINASTTPLLTILDASRNGIEQLANLNLEHLSILKLEGNRLTSAAGFGNLNSLKELHLQSNLISTLDGLSPQQKSLAKLDCRDNKISKLEDIRKLEILKGLLELYLADNAVAEEPEYRMESIVSIGSLQILDEEPYEAEEKLEAAKQRNQRQRNEQAKPNEPVVESSDPA